LNKITVVLLIGIAISSSFAALAFGAFLDSNHKRVELESKYEQLQEQYQMLNTMYLFLNKTYFDLSQDYEDLHMNYVSLSNSYTSLNQNYSDIKNKYYSLEQNYYGLSNNYEALDQNYLNLQTQYSSLNTLCSQLTVNYVALNTTYNVLNQNYNDLDNLFNQPLDYVLVPTWDEVTQWLELDKTDEIAYNSSSFLCGEFSIMLIQHAREKHWRMLFTIIEFDYYSENPNGTQNHHGNHGHAFVSINTTEGMVYIEPQTDYTWYLYETGEPETYLEFGDWEFYDFGEEWFGHIFVQYYNRMGPDVELIEYSAASIEVGPPK